MKVAFAVADKIVPIFFISHMVQMKVTELNPYINRLNGFISHMVQMKGIGGLISYSLRNGFISHMVQMKEYQ